MMEYIRRNVVDEVFVHLSSQTNLPINKIIKELEVMGVTVDLNINVFEMEIPVQREIRADRKLLYRFVQSKDPFV